MRFEEKECHDKKYSICIEELVVRQVVLLYNTRRKKDMSQKLSFKLLRPYRICNTVKDKGIYILQELDRSCLAGIFTGDCLKNFYPRQALCLDQTPDLTRKVVPTIEYCFTDYDEKLSNIPDNISDF